VSDARKKSLMVFAAVSSLWGVVFGFIGPFYVVYLEKLSGGMEKLGIAFAIMVLLQSASTYVAGHYSDRLGRKPFLIVTAFVDAVILYLYTVISSPAQLYILQAMLGITNGVAGTIKASLLGDLTVRQTRGSVIGRFDAVVSLASAGGLAMSGYLVKFYGLEFLFYLASGTVACSSVMLFFIKEPEDAPAQP
jgi:DHA1 family multidrug resistance protein-like MFS transporter